MAKKIGFVGNSLLTMCNFRMGVMRHLVHLGYEVVVIVPQDGDTEILRQEHIRLIPIEVDCKGTNPIADIQLAKTLLKIYRREQFDFLFHYTIKSVIYGSWAARNAGIPQIPVITGLGYTFLKKNLLNRLVISLYKRTIRSAESVWFLNQTDQQVFTSLNILPFENTRLINGEGVDTKKYHTTRLLTTNPFTFLYIGRMLWDKGVGLFVEAARIIKERYPQAVFNILGPLSSDNPNNISPTQLEEWHNSGVVNYIGCTSNVLPHVEESTCIVLPTFYPEGMPRVLMEAASMQRPIIASNVPGCREVVIDGKNGFLCLKKNVNSLVASMEKMLTLSQQELIDMGAAGREHVLQLFDEQKIIAIYQQQLEKYFSLKPSQIC